MFVRVNSKIKVAVFVGLPGEYQVVSIHIGAAETRGCTNVAGRGNKKSKKYVFDRRQEYARAAGFAPYAMIDGVGLGPVVIAGIKLLVIDHQLAVKQIQFFHSGMAMTRIVGSRREPYQHADAVFSSSAERARPGPCLFSGRDL